MKEPTGKLKFAFQTITYLETKIDQLEAEIKDLKEWIPVSERLPEGIGCYIIWDGEVIAWAFFSSDKKWCGYNGQNCSYKATHWKPLPEPPKDNPIQKNLPTEFAETLQEIVEPPKEGT